MIEGELSAVAGAPTAATISHEQVSAVAEFLIRRYGSSTPQAMKWDNPLFWNVDASKAERCQFIAIGNAMNFRFWTLKNGEMVPAVGSIEGESYRGSMYLWRRLRVGVARNEFSLNAEWLSALTEDGLERAFKDDDGNCPLVPGIADRAKNLRDLGAGLLSSWQGRFDNVVRAADGSLKSFAELSAAFRAFDDPVRKLTMVNAIMLTGSGLAQFDENPLPGIDYHLVKQAVRQGLVVPSGVLIDKLKARQFLTASESVVLRQATLEALLQLSREAGISTDIIDNAYWLNGRVCDDRLPACQAIGGPQCPFEQVCLQRTDLGSPIEETRYY
ncbi:queuosine salvage family protein [Actinomadura sp. NPDC048955]|uniref:queuosine salvage family protein n=1 Tax=Actinomadura sp. NPDC048955 TaxID=3158228 RepID=UPI0033F03181